MNAENWMGCDWEYCLDETDRKKGGESVVARARAPWALHAGCRHVEEVSKVPGIPFTKEHFLKMTVLTSSVKKLLIISLISNM